MEITKPNKLFLCFLFCIFLLGICLRFYQINQNHFLFYDEGMWLNYNRGFVELVDSNPPKNFSEFLKITHIMAYQSLPMAKSLWAFINQARVFFAASNDWYVIRIFSAIFGSLTLLMIYLYVLRLYSDRFLALLSTLLLAVLPSHVFYSQLALQEAFSTFCFLSGVYFYHTANRFNWRNILSSLFFVCVYLSNYRMIILPVVILLIEIGYAKSFKKPTQFSKYFVNMAIFIFTIIVIGSLANGANFKATFGWMFKQADMAQGHFDVLNFLSFPYYLFRLEHFLFGGLFLGCVYLVKRRDWSRLYPFMVSLFVMGLFSLPQEKGVRYICFILPFIVISVANLINFLYYEYTNRKARTVILALIAVLVISLGLKSILLVKSHSDYEDSWQDLMVLEEAPLKVISTQHRIHRLYADNASDVAELKNDFRRFMLLYAQGYRYLIIDPQAYVSLTEDERRFSLKLKGFIGFIDAHVKPLKVYDHMNPHLLERFVFEHNENLITSIRFLNKRKELDLGKLSVYDAGTFIEKFKEISNQ